jgi:hypothetical protein
MKKILLILTLIFLAGSFTKLNPAYNADNQNIGPDTDNYLSPAPDVVTDSTKILAPDQLKSDLDLVKKALETRHPEMHKYISSEEFGSLYNSTRELLNKPMPVRDFYCIMSPLISSLKCGHTKWIAPNGDGYYPFYQTDLFPLRLFFKDRRAYIISHYSGQEVPVLSEVISINGEPLNCIIEFLLQRLSFADGNSTQGKYYELNNFFPGIYSTFYGPSAGYEIELLNKDQKTESCIYRGVTKELIDAYMKRVSVTDQPPYTFSMIDNNTGWMDIDRFFSYPGEPGFKKFLKKSFRQLKNRNVQNLVIDLRGNEGGIEKRGIDLYKYLALAPFRYYDNISVKKQRKEGFDEDKSFVFKCLNLFISRVKNTLPFAFHKGLKRQKPFQEAFHGKLFLLIDGQSYSVTTEFASRAKSDGRAIIIGQESAGGYALNTSGLFSIITLPHSKIVLGVPLLGFNMSVRPDKNPVDRGIIPDNEIEISQLDIVKSIDPVKNFTLELIKKTSFSKTSD